MKRKKMGMPPGMSATRLILFDNPLVLFGNPFGHAARTPLNMSATRLKLSAICLDMPPGMSATRFSMSAPRLNPSAAPIFFP